MNILEYLSIWYRSLLICSISLFILSIYLLTIDEVLIRYMGGILLTISIIAIIFSFLGMFSVWPFGCDSRWPKIIPGKGGELFPWKKALMFNQCVSDNDCCQSYNVPMTCQGKNPDSGIPKICMPTKWNCKTSEGTGYNNCISGYSKITDPSTGKYTEVGSFGQLAMEVAPYLGAAIGGGLGFIFGGPLGAVAGAVGGDIGGAELASLLPGAGPGPGDKNYWGAGTDFKKITINVSGTYNTVQECENECKTTVDSYKNSDFTKCQSYAKKYCKGNDLKDVKSCQACLSKNQGKIDTCQPSGKKPDNAASQKGINNGCPEGDIWCGSGIEVDQAKCEQMVKQITDEEINSMINCPSKLKDNNICSTNTELTGDIKNCTNCIDENINKIEELGCPKNMTDRDKIILCNQMSYYYRI